MITCVIKVVETIEGVVTTIEPDERDSSRQERMVASVYNIAMQAANDFIQDSMKSKSSKIVTVEGDELCEKFKAILKTKIPNL